MSNVLIHRTVAAESETVETVKQLRQAISDLTSVDGAMELDDTYVVELLQKTFSDGSLAFSIRIRLAEPQI